MVLARCTPEQISVSERSLETQKAEEVKIKHASDHPDYQYQPREPSDERRRVTKRRAEQDLEG